MEKNIKNNMYMGITDYLLYSRLAQYCESTMLQVKKLF